MGLFAFLFGRRQPKDEEEQAFRRRIEELV